jgi:hypothetical protein
MWSSAHFSMASSAGGDQATSGPAEVPPPRAALDLIGRVPAVRVGEQQSRPVLLLIVRSERHANRSRLQSASELSVSATGVLVPAT